jgi:predicted MFS family arabinose efflux permease
VAISLLVPPILLREGWQEAMAACGMVVLVTLPPIILLLMREPKTSHAATPETQPEPESLSADDIPVAPTTLQILQMGSFWLLVICIVPIAIAALAVGINVIPFLAERGVATQEAGYVLAGIGAASAIGALAIGAIVDRIHPAWVIAGVASLAVFCLTAVATGVGNPAIFFVAMYAGLAGVAPTMAVGVRRLFGVAAYAPIAGLIGPFLLLSAFSGAGTGWLRDHLGSYQPVFAMIAALCAASLVAALVLARRPLAAQ